MSAKEQKRMVTMANVKAGRMSLREAAEALGLSYRQAKRVWERYRAEARGSPRPTCRDTENSRAFVCIRGFN